MKYSQNFISFILLVLLGFITACSTNNDDTTRYYKFTYETDEIHYALVAKTSDPGVIATVENELEKPFDERSMHINGLIERGNPGYNSDWSWHFDENQWDLADFSAEVCDGRPDFIEEDLDYWVDQVGRFCPWGSRVEAEVNP